MKNKLKIILCIVSCVCVLFCSSLSVLAFDVNSSYGESISPIWNIDRIECSRDGEILVFEPPVNFFSVNTDGFSDIENTYTLSKSGISYSLEFSIIQDQNDTIILRIIASQDIDYLTIYFEDTIIPYNAYNPATGEILSNDHTFTCSGGSGVTTITNFSFGIPDYTFRNNKLVGVDYKKLYIPTLTDYRIDTVIGESQGTGSFSCVPNSDALSMASQGNPVIDVGLYRGQFLHCFDHSFTVETGENFNGNIVFLFQGHTDIYKFNFYDYMKSTFPTYLIPEQGNNAPDISLFGGFGGFLMTVLSGFLSFEIIPGLAVSTIFIGIIGISLVSILLKFFSGG